MGASQAAPQGVGPVALGRLPKASQSLSEQPTPQASEAQKGLDGRREAKRIASFWKKMNVLTSEPPYLLKRFEHF